MDNIPSDIRILPLPFSEYGELAHDFVSSYFLKMHLVVIQTNELLCISCIDVAHELHGQHQVMVLLGSIHLCFFGKFDR